MRSRVTAASAASTRQVRNDGAVLRAGRNGALCVLQGWGFDAARGSIGVAAEVPVVSCGVADDRDRRQFLGCRRRVGTWQSGAVVDCRLGVGCGAEHSTSRDLFEQSRARDVEWMINETLGAFDELIGCRKGGVGIKCRLIGPVSVKPK